jgi:hypothetical protein
VQEKRYGNAGVHRERKDSQNKAAMLDKTLTAESVFFFFFLSSSAPKTHLKSGAHGTGDVLLGVLGLLGLGLTTRGLKTRGGG